MPDAVCRVIERALAKDPADRPPSAAALAEALEAARLKAARTEPQRPNPPTTPPAPDGTRPPARTGGIWPLVVGAVAVLASGTAGLLALVHERTATPTTTAVVPQRGAQVLRRDDFSRIDSWVHEDGLTTARGLAKGGYRVVVKNRGFRLASPIPTRDLPRDLRIEVDASTPTNVVTEAGVGCRGGSDAVKPRYEARIASTGLWHIDKIDAETDTAQQPLAPLPPEPAKSPAIRAVGPNHISLECVGQDPVTLRLTVNDTLVAEVHDARPLAGDRAALVVLGGDPGSDALFDNLLVTAL